MARVSTRFGVAALVVVIALAVITGSRTSFSQARTERTADQASSPVVRALSSATTFGQTAISPDASRVAWVENVRGGTEIYVSGTASYGRAGAAAPGPSPATKPVRITAASGAGVHSETAVAWSPDSTRVAFLSDAAAPGQLQLYVSAAAGGGAHKLTNVQGFLAAPAWSPDGRTIAVLFIANATRAAGPLVAETARTGVIRETITEQRVALVDVQSGALRQISPADMYVYEYGWAPDGRHLVMTAARGNGDNNWWIAQVYTIEAAGGPMRSLCRPALQAANPSWSPDGKSVAFIGGLMSDFGVTGGDVFLVPAEGGTPKDITPGMRASASSLVWAPDGKTILFGEEVDGASGIASVDVATGRIDTLWQGPEQLNATGYVTAFSLAGDGKTTAVIRHSLSKPPEVWAGAIGRWTPITSRNRDVGPAWGEVRNVHWTNDGLDVQGWLIYPRDFDPARTYPMVVNVHGGPASMARTAWPGPQSYYIAPAADGYFVFLPNPRGSYGQGEAFTRANVKDFGYGDFRDIMAGVDRVLKQAPIDGRRLGITGWSYGGYMTMWAVTQTGRFRAAVAGAGIANFQSYYGQNEIDQWMIPYFGASVYDDPQVYARSSPITFIRNAKTPTLILVGDSDGECPAPQSFEFWHALHTLGVENEFVVYEHEGHSFANPAHNRDRVERVLAWFDRHLAAPAASDRGQPGRR